MSQPVPKPHRLKLYLIEEVDGEQKLTLDHEEVYPSKAEAERAKRYGRQLFGSRYSSATIEPEPPTC